MYIAGGGSPRRRNSIGDGGFSRASEESPVHRPPASPARGGITESFRVGGSGAADAAGFGAVGGAGAESHRSGSSSSGASGGRSLSPAPPLTAAPMPIAGGSVSSTIAAGRAAAEGGIDVTVVPKRPTQPATGGASNPRGRRLSTVTSPLGEGGVGGSGGSDAATGVSDSTLSLHSHDAPAPATAFMPTPPSGSRPVGTVSLSPAASGASSTLHVAASEAARSYLAGERALARAHAQNCVQAHPSAPLFSSRVCVQVRRPTPRSTHS